MGFQGGGPEWDGDISRGFIEEPERGNKAPGDQTAQLILSFLQAYKIIQLVRRQIDSQDHCTLPSWGLAFSTPYPCLVLTGQGETKGSPAPYQPGSNPSRLKGTGPVVAALQRDPCTPG